MTAEDLRKSILQQAIQGKLVPQDPKDEPASELLARIREEKERLVKEKKIKRDKNESIIYRGEDNSYYEKILATGEVKCIDEEIPFEIPQSWEWARMGAIGDWGSGSTPSRGNPSYYGGHIPWLKTGELNDGIVYNTEEKITEKALKECSLRLNSIGDVLIAMYGATIGKVALAGTPMTTNQACCGCTPIFINNEYLFYFLLASKADFIKKGEGGAQPNISREKLVSHLMPIAPLNEQGKIIRVLKHIFPNVDKYKKTQIILGELNSRIKEQLKKSVLQYAIQGKLVPQIPDDPSAVQLLEQLSDEKVRLLKDGKLKKKDINNSTIYRGDDNKYYEQIGNRVIDITEEIPYELPQNWIFTRLSTLCWLDDGVKQSGEQLPYMDAKYHRGKGDVCYHTTGKVVDPQCKVILVDGENSGEIFNVTERGYLGSTFKVLKISKFISEEWLHKILDNYRDLFKNSKVGAAIPHLNKNLFKNLIIGLPPLKEQTAISSKIDLIFKSIGD